ncbi:hypothetical protein LTS17_011402 [Exophiala oligosperma]
MDTIVENKDVLFPQVFSHLAEVEAQPATVLLDEELLRRAERSLDASTSRDLLWRLLATGEKLLQILQQEPRPLTRLLERNVSLLPFDELKGTISTEKLQEGLTSPSISVQLFCLAYLQKAADSPSGASFVAASSPLVQCLLTIWLSSESTEIAERCLEAIEALLAVDSHSSFTVVSTKDRLAEAQGQGLLWRRIFTDPQVYSIMFEWTSLRVSNRDVKTKKVESRFMGEGVDDQPYGGLLRYAASHMIDQRDILMEVLRQDFFMKLLAVIQEGNPQSVPPRLLEALQNQAGIDPTKDDERNGVHL